MEATEQSNSNFNFVKLTKIIIFIAIIASGGYFLSIILQSDQGKIGSLIEKDPSLAISKLDHYLINDKPPEWVKQDFSIAYYKLIEIKPTLAANKLEGYLQNTKSSKWLQQVASAAYSKLIQTNPVLVTKRLDHYVQQDNVPKWVKQDFAIAYFKLIEIKPTLAANKLEGYLQNTKSSKWLKQAASVAYFRLIQTNPVLATKRLNRFMHQDNTPKWVKENFSVAYFRSIATHTGKVDYYDTFRSLMNLSEFSDIREHFKFIEVLEKDDAENNLFVENKDELETYYFYYDTGRVFSYKRGFALTENALIWKNMFQSVHVIDFDAIKHISLHYAKGFSLTGWNIVINNDEDLSIRLSEVTDEDLLYFLNNILLFINSNRSVPTKIILDIPSSEQKILAGSIWERHSGIITGTLALGAYALAETYAPNQANAIRTSVRQSAVNFASKFSASMPMAIRNQASKFSKYMAGMASKSKTITADAKARAISLGRGIAVNVKALPKAFKSFKVFDKSGKQIGKYKIKDLYKSEDVVRMPYKGIKGVNIDKAASNVSLRGFERNNSKFWKEFLKKPNAKNELSQNNIIKIKRGRSPEVDGKWIKSHPTHKQFRGEKLEHHHINHGPKAIPLPDTLHKGAINYKIWHTE